MRWKVASDDFELRFLNPLLSAGFLAIWLRQRGNRYAIVRFWCAKGGVLLQEPEKIKTTLFQGNPNGGLANGGLAPKGAN